MLRFPTLGLLLAACAGAGGVTTGTDVVLSRDGGADGGLELDAGTTAPPALVVPFGLQAVESSVAVDGAGRAHVGAVSSETGTLLYATCAADCTTAQRWSTVAFGTSGPADFALALRVTPDGKPRLVVVRAAGTIDYFACDADCTTAASWKSTTAMPASALAHPSPDEAGAFAVGPSGQAAIFSTQASGKSLAFCKASCTDSASWRVSVLGPSAPTWADVQLAFTPAGGLALAAEVIDQTQTPSHQVGYFECQAGADCLLSTNWPGVVLSPTAANARLALAFDGPGRPRIATLSDDTRQGALEVLSCNADCAGVGTWQVLRLPWTAAGPTATKRVALAVAPGTAAVLAWRSADSAQLARCASSTCVESTGGWKTFTLGTSASLTTALPFTHACPSGAWHFDAGRLSVGLLGSAGYLVGADLEAVASSGQCDGATTFERRPVLTVQP